MVGSSRLSLIHLTETGGVKGFPCKTKKGDNMPKLGKKSILEAAKRPEVVNDSIEGVTQKALAGTPVIKTNQHWDAFSLFDGDNPENQEYMREDRASGFAESENSTVYSMVQASENEAMSSLFGFDVPIDS